MIWLLFILLIVYSILIILTVLEFITKQVPGSSNSGNVKFSVIIPYRNESEHLPALINSLGLLNYPAESAEFIFCNDHSDDYGDILLPTLLKSFPFRVRCISNPEGRLGKKQAITMAVSVSNNPFIITTDADCTVREGWLSAYSDILNSADLKLVAGPVVYQTKTEKGIMRIYQVIENAGLIVFGAFGFFRNRPFIANGANLCFERSAFLKVDGYSGNDMIPSGDDDFLLRKFKVGYPGKMAFLNHRNALVSTEPQENFAGFLNQRVRWASKSKYYSNKSVFLIQFTILLLFSLLVSSPIWLGWKWGLGFICFKILADTIFYGIIRNFFNLKLHFIYASLCSFLQLFIIPIVALKSISGTYSWKGRTHKI